MNGEKMYQRTARDFCASEEKFENIKEGLLLACGVIALISIMGVWV